MFLEIAQLANCDNGTAESLEMDESVTVSFLFTMLLMLNVNEEENVCLLFSFWHG